jgi:HlyD family secretion protein
VLAVPIQAVVIREVDREGKVVDPDAGATPEEPATPRARGEEKEGVFVVEGETAVFKPVKVGIMGDTEIEVQEGVVEGQEIVTGSYRTLRTLKDQGRIRREEKKKDGKE